MQLALATVGAAFVAHGRPRPLVAVVAVVAATLPASAQRDEHRRAVAEGQICRLARM